MKLVELSADAASLEMSPREVPSVLRRLATLAQVSREQRATYDLIHVGENSFVFESDWGDPCLISKSAAGTEVLRSLITRAARTNRGVQTTSRLSARSEA